MKIIFGGSLYDIVAQRFMGYEFMFRSLFVEPDLMKAVFNRWGLCVQERNNGKPELYLSDSRSLKEFLEITNGSNFFLTVLKIH